MLQFQSEILTGELRVLGGRGGFWEEMLKQRLKGG